MRLRDRAAPRSVRREELAVAAAQVHQAIERDVDALGLGPAMYMSSLEHETTVIVDLAGDVHAILGRVLDGEDYIATAARPDGAPWAPLATGAALEARRARHRERLVAAVIADIDGMQLGPSTRRVDRDGRLRIYDAARRVHAVIGVWPGRGPEEIAQTLYGARWPVQGPKDERGRPVMRRELPVPPHAYDEHALTLAVERWVVARGGSITGRGRGEHTGRLELLVSDAPGIHIGVDHTGAMRATGKYGDRWQPWSGPRWPPGVHPRQGAPGPCW